MKMRPGNPVSPGNIGGEEKLSVPARLTIVIPKPFSVAELAISLKSAIG
jgi:hypothetical protein